MSLNAKSVSSLAPRAGSDRTAYFDKGSGGVAGLCVRVTSSGHRSYWFRYECEGTKRWLPLGDVTDMSLAVAREKARELGKRVRTARRGEAPFPHQDVAAERRAAAEASPKQTIEDAVEGWLESATFKSLRPSTRREYERVARKLVIPAFGSLSPGDVRRDDVASFLLDIRDGTVGREVPRFTLTAATKNRKPAGVMANRVRAVLGSFYGWATAVEQRELHGVTDNPLVGMERIFSEPEPQPRVYTPAELRSLLAAAGDNKELRHLVPLIALTLTRSNEARGARWSEFDFERNMWTIPPDRSKDRRPHMVPLSKGALRVLERLRTENKVVDIRSAAFLFPAPTSAGYMDQPQDSIVALREASGVADFNLHPLRDTAVHWLIEELGVRGDVVEDLLSHTPTRLERTYRGERRSSLAEMRRALDLWSNRLSRMARVASSSRGRKGRPGEPADRTAQTQVVSIRSQG
jgi:integrase